MVVSLTAIFPPDFVHFSLSTVYPQRSAAAAGVNFRFRPPFRPLALGYSGAQMAPPYTMRIDFAVLQRHASPLSQQQDWTLI